MTKGLSRSISRGKTVAPIVKQAITVKNLAIAVAGTTGIGWGTAVIGDFPAGNVVFLAAVSYLQFSSSDGDIQTTYDGDYAIGTAPTADLTLSGAEVDLIPSTALGAATAGLSPMVRATHAVAVTGTVYDNTDGTLEVNLNLLIDDINISGTADMLANGVVYLSYIMLGDD